MKEVLNAIFQTEEKMKSEAAQCDIEASQIQAETEKKAEALASDFEKVFSTDKNEKFKKQDDVLKKAEENAINQAKINAGVFREKLESRKKDVFKALLSVFIGE